MGTNIPIKSMAPLIQVFDMPTSLNFYCDLIGFSIVQSAGPPDDIGFVMLRLNGITLMLNTLYEKHERPPAPEVDRMHHHSDTALYFGCPDVESWYRQLKDKGVQLKPPYVTGYGFKAVDLLDPDGYHLCFHWPVESSGV